MRKPLHRYKKNLPALNGRDSPSCLSYTACVQPRIRALLLWSLWVVPLVLTWLYLDRQARSVTVTPGGVEFLLLIQDALIMTLLLTLLIPGPVLATPRRGCLVGICCLGVTFVSGIALNKHGIGIAYERTPACWGIHSSDWGSGKNCPPGMREDFTLEQIREYDRSGP